MKIIFFDNKIEKFMKRLNANTLARAIRTIELLNEFEYRLGLPHSKSIGKGLFELRIHGRHNVRILYVFHKEYIVLLHGFIKKTNQIPKKEFNTALQKKKQLD
ncbi:MAG: type II toxin-antitoxin system RelE/ParE family toxin [Candidatus Uhrbacteria bacterium]